jgi:hypothetical protein
MKCQKKFPAHAVSMVVAIPPLTAAAIVMSTAIQDGRTISRARAATNVATVTSGPSYVSASLIVISTFAKPACVKVEPYLRPRLTISNLRAMAVPMMMPTLRDCAGLAIEPRPPESDWGEGRGGSNLSPSQPKGPPL